MDAGGGRRREHDVASSSNRPDGLPERERMASFDAQPAGNRSMTPVDRRGADLSSVENHGTHQKSVNRVHRLAADTVNRMYFCNSVIVNVSAVCSTLTTSSAASRMFSSVIAFRLVERGFDHDRFTTAGDVTHDVDFVGELSREPPAIAIASSSRTS